MLMLCVQARPAFLVTELCVCLAKYSTYICVKYRLSDPFDCCEYCTANFVKTVASCPDRWTVPWLRLVHPWSF